MDFLANMISIDIFNYISFPFIPDVEYFIYFLKESHLIDIY